MFSNADEVLRFIKDEGVKFVDVRFCDLPGVMQHFNVPAESVDEDFFADGPDVRRLVDPRLPGHPRVGHEADPRPDDGLRRPVPGREDAHPQLLHRRPVHRRALQPRPAQHRGQGRGVPRAARASPTPCYFGPEAEFYVFDDVRFETKQNAGYYYIDSIEGAWNTGRVEEGGNRGYKTRYKGGYFPVPPVDHYADLRDEMVARAERGRPRGRARAPRGRHRRSGRDQLQVRHAAARRPTS